MKLATYRANGGAGVGAIDAPGTMLLLLCIWFEGRLSYTCAKENDVVESSFPQPDQPSQDMPPLLSGKVYCTLCHFPSSC